MDDQDDSDYSRAPELEDLLALCQALNSEGVRYVLIGGFAVILHGFVRATKDIDLLVDASAENIQRLKRAMAFLPDNAVALIGDDEVRTSREAQRSVRAICSPIEAAPPESRPVRSLCEVLASPLRSAEAARATGGRPRSVASRK